MVLADTSYHQYQDSRAILGMDTGFRCCPLCKVLVMELPLGIPGILTVAHMSQGQNSFEGDSTGILLGLAS